MAAISDMALGRLADLRYFLGIVHDSIKTGFMRKFLHTNGIYCVLLAINSSKQRKDNQCQLPMVSSECVSRYCDLFTTETKELSFFHQLGI